jgi:hypothetical protein
MTTINEIDFPGNKKDSEFFLIGNESKSDKIFQHHYYQYYPKFIEYYKNFNNLAMLEIGIENKFSLNLWLEYFPNAFIYGIDINISDKGDRYQIFKANQSNINDLNFVINEISKPLFFILDDGSHIPEHQILTFDKLFDILLPGGTYIIEDIETSYWTNANIYSYKVNYGYKNENSIIEFFKLLVDDINNLYLTEKNKNIQKQIISNKISEKTRKNISTITFAQNCIIITKKTNQEISNTHNEYYWKERL